MNFDFWLGFALASSLGLIVIGIFTWLIIWQNNYIRKELEGVEK